MPGRMIKREIGIYREEDVYAREVDVVFGELNV
jgi:hypothetical protein